MLSVSLIASVSRIPNCCGAGARRHVAADHVIDGRKGRGAVAGDAAIGPFDAAVAGRHGRVGQHRQPALEAARLRDLVELALGRRRRYRRRCARPRAAPSPDAEGFGGERGNLGERLARDQLGRELAGDRDRDFHRFGSPAAPRCRERACAAAPCRRRSARGAAVPAAGCAWLAGGKAVAIGLRFGVRAPALGLDQGDGRRFLAGGEILVEQIFGGRFHQ